MTSIGDSVGSFDNVIGESAQDVGIVRQGGEGGERLTMQVVGQLTGGIQTQQSRVGALA